MNSDLFRIEYFETLDSTSTYLESRKDEKEGLVIVANNQTNGRGQNNNQWVSNHGGLYFSFLLKPKLLMPTLSIMTGLVIIKTLESFGINNLKLKWPNDILFNNSKISGILIESKIKSNVPEYVIIGCGINVNQEAFSNIHEYTPTSMKLITNTEYQTSVVLEKFLSIFNTYYQRYLSEQSDFFIEELQDIIYLKNQLIQIISYGDQIIEGKLTGINSDGGLILKTLNGDKIIYSGRIIKNPSI